MTTALPSLRGYRVLRQIGEGAMGRVYLAEEELLERRVAIKMITPARAGEGESRARFLREARAMAGVEHPHVVRVYALGEADGQPYLVMEYVEGETLADHLARLGRLHVDQALRIAREVAQALAAAWRRGIVHRDVKPANILLDAQEHAKVSDFGLAHASGGAGADLTASGLIAGTPHYISPEQARGEEPDFRSDVYSLGIVLYEMLGGERPFSGRSAGELIAHHLRDPVPLLRARRPEIPSSVDALVQSMTAKRPGERPPSYPALVRQLASPGAVDEGEATATRTALAASPRRRAPRLVLAAAAAIVLALAALGVARQGHRRHGSFAVALAPLSAPDAESEKEGRVLTALLESELRRRLPEDDVDVMGADDVGKPARSARGAREIADRLDADVVVWGEALAFGGEVALAPHIARRDGTVVADVPEASFPAAAANAIEFRRQRAAALADRVAALYPRR